MRKLDLAFYERRDVAAVARDLLGKALCSRVDGRLTRAVITETEAYAGTRDRASHAYGGKRTPRTEPMYAPGGTAYVYLCYGIHHLFNVVTSVADDPQAVLVRAGSPLSGLELMLKRRGMAREAARLLAGPGSLAKALGIHTRHSGTQLTGTTLWIEDHGIAVDERVIATGPRIGVDYAGEDAALPYRFVIPRSVVERD